MRKIMMIPVLALALGIAIAGGVFFGTGATEALGRYVSMPCAKNQSGTIKVNAGPGYFQSRAWYEPGDVYTAWKLAPHSLNSRIVIHSFPAKAGKRIANIEIQYQSRASVLQKLCKS